MSWLANATALGSHNASKHLQELDHDAWQKAHLRLATKNCGVGRPIFSVELMRYSDESLPLPTNLSVSEEVDANGDTLLHLAATLGRQDVVAKLCEGVSCRDLNKQNQRGETALLQATRSGHFEITQYLLSLGADASLTTSNGEIVLHWLSSFKLQTEDDMLSIAQKMNGNGASLEQICQQNTVYNAHFRFSLGPGTPLHRAVQRDAYRAAWALVKVGANPFYPEDDYPMAQTHRFPMALACSMHMTRFINLFL